MLKVYINKIILKKEKRILLENFDYEFLPNNCYALLGKNGSGKSTLLLAINNFINKIDFDYSGECEFNGFNLDSNDMKTVQKFRKENIRYIFQDSQNAFDPLKKLKFYFNIVTNSGISISDISQIFQNFNLPSFDKLKNKYIYELSGGMAQRLQIALALVTKPKFIFLDEPNSALDKNSSKLICKSISHIREKCNTTILMVTQDINFAMECSTQIGILKNSKIETFYDVKNISKNELKNSLL